MMYLILFFVGMVELFLGIVDFKLTQKNRKVLSSVSTFIDVMLWYFVIMTIISYIDNIYLAIVYATGSAIGCYIGLKCEPIFDKWFKRKYKKLNNKRKKNKRKRKT